MNVKGFAPPRAVGAVRRRRGAWRGCVVAFAAVVAAGCGTIGGGLGPDTPVAEKEQVVRERANARWQALIKRDYPAAYGYLSAASRSSISLPAYKARFEAAQYRAVTIENVDCASGVCKVRVQLTFDLPAAKGQGLVVALNEDWIIDQGQAWFVFRG